MIQFFKSQVLPEIEEEYSEIFEDIKLLKENYMLMRDGFDQPSNFFREIAGKLHDRLDSAHSIQAVMRLLPEDRRTEFLENFCDTMIYEKIGSYLLKSLASLYTEDELSFINKCEAIYQISRTDRDHFNQLFQCQIPSSLTPKISSKILKIMHRC